MNRKINGTSLSVQLGGLMFVRMLVNTVHRMVYPLLPVFSASLGISIASFSSLIALRSALGGLSPFLAWISDRNGRRFGLLLGSAAFIGGLAIVVFWSTLPGFFIAIILAGIGKYLIDPTMHAFLGDRVPFASRGRAIAFVEYGWSLSYLVGVPLVAFVISRGGWMAPFPLLLVLAILGFVLLYRIIPAQLAEEKQAGLQFSFWAQGKKIVQSPVTRASLLLGFFISAANEMISLIFGVWLEGSFDLSVTALGGATFVIGVAELFGEGFVSRWTDQIGKKNAVAAGTILNTLITLLFPMLGKTLWGALLLLFLFYLTFEFSIVSSISLISELAPSARATLLGFFVTALAFGRAAADLIAPYSLETGLSLVLGITIVFNLLGLLSLRTIPTINPLAPSNSKPTTPNP